MKGLGGVEVEEGITVAAFKLPPGDREARWGGLKSYWLEVGSGEPCFQGRPILYFMNHYAFTLPLQGYVPRLKSYYCNRNSHSIFLSLNSFPGFCSKSLGGQE